MDKKTRKQLISGLDLIIPYVGAAVDAGPEEFGRDEDDTSNQDQVNDAHETLKWLAMVRLRLANGEVLLLSKDELTELKFAFGHSVSDPGWYGEMLGKSAKRKKACLSVANKINEKVALPDG